VLLVVGLNFFSTILQNPFCGSLVASFSEFLEQVSSDKPLLVMEFAVLIWLVS
jgi:hypothetical protein